jgi:hypothetical protein
MNDLLVNVVVGLGGCSLLHVGTLFGSSKGDLWAAGRYITLDLGTATDFTQVCVC